MKYIRILRPRDFFNGVDWSKVRELLLEKPLETIMALIIYYVIAIIAFGGYYLTFIPRFLNEQVELFVEWNL